MFLFLFNFLLNIYLKCTFLLSPLRYAYMCLKMEWPDLSFLHFNKINANAKYWLALSEFVDIGEVKSSYYEDNFIYFVTMKITSYILLL